ncbi:MAG: trigger factor [bacterium]|nr:trigger factor [bacterium]
MGAVIKEISSSQIEITVEIPAVDFEKEYKRTLERYNKELKIPGFRSGHIPENILREKVGEGTLLQDAAEDAIQAWYEKFLAEKNIEAIGAPNASITKMARNNPLGVTLITATMPKFVLPDYKGIAKEVMEKKVEVTVEEKEIDDTLEHLKSSRQKRGSPEAAKLKAQNSKVEEQSSKSGEEQPDQEAVNDIPIDDEFARSVGDFKTLAELREAIRANIMMEKETKKKEEKRMMILERVAEKITVTIPDIMITSEKNKMMGELRSSIENMGMKWDDYTSHVKKTEEEIKNGWGDQARKRVMFGLILRALSKEENIVVDDTELDAFVERLKKQYGYEHTDAHASEHLRDYAYGVLKNEKVFQMLEQQ